MKKKSTIFSDLSKKQLEHLKTFYIQKKVDSMNNNQLRNFVRDIITHQITDTIDKEEEKEAWTEMSEFFGEQFEIIISEIMQKYKNDEDLTYDESDPQKQRQELLEKNSGIESEKEDMWVD